MKLLFSHLIFQGFQFVGAIDQSHAGEHKLIFNEVLYA